MQGLQEQELSKRLEGLSPAKRQLILRQLERKRLQQARVSEGIPRRPAGQRAPLSFGQQRLWFLHKLTPELTTYHIPLAVRLGLPDATIDPRLVEQAINGIARRHEVLRTSFPEIDGEPVQVVEPELHISLTILDLRGIPDAELRPRISRVVEAHVTARFDLAQGPILRAMLIHLPDNTNILNVVVHHIAFDGWSIPLFMHEFGVHYLSLAQDKDLPLPDLPIQFGDYAAWQRDWLQGAVLEEHLDFWKNLLAGAPNLLELPTDHPRPPVATHRGAFHELLVNHDLSNRLHDLAHATDTSLFMVLLAAFQVLLYRYSGQNRIVIGSPSANRNRSEVEPLIGFFLNTLALCTDMSGNPSVNELLERVRTVMLGAYAHEDLPFDLLVDRLQPERSLSYSPIFQVMLSLQVKADVFQKSRSNAGQQFFEEGRERSTVQTDFDLDMSLTEMADGLAGTLRYSSDLFERATIERMASHYIQLLEGIVAQPEARIEDLPLLTEEEAVQRRGWNATVAPIPPVTVDQLVAEHALRTPHASALCFGDVTLSYAEVDGRANQLAHHLQSLGVGPDTLVGLYLERSPDLVVAMLAVWKAGGAYVPLDPSYPPERLALMLTDAAAPLLVTQSALLPSVPPGAPQVLVLDDPELPWSSLPTTPPSSAALPGNLAYVLYTSGSTGRPKGVQIPHGAVVNFLSSMQEVTGITPDDRLLAVTSLSFDIAVLELLLPLVSGASVEVLPWEVTIDGVQLRQALEDEGITLMQATPATWTLLRDAGWTGSSQLTILCGGEALPPQLATFLTQAGRQLLNVYGPTETTIWSSVQPLTPDAERITIGYPLANTQLWILDAGGHQLPIGVPGELFIGGAGLARGYRDRPGLTAERFLPDPFGPPGSRLYRTGDRVRRLPDGSLEYLGRLDFQVKLRGFRIELGEIEARLEAHPAISRAVVLVQGEEASKRLVAYVVPQGELPATEELRASLAQRLPAYMLPSQVIPLETFPLTPNGKLDRKALPAPDAALLPPREYVPPSSSLEETIAQVWQEVLGLEQVGIHDNFFELGGHSLLLVQVSSRLNRQLEREIPIIDLFRYPTIHLLARSLEAGSQLTVSLDGAQDRAAKRRQRLQQVANDAESA